MASPLEIYSKDGLANWVCSAKWGKFVGKWPMADCYFKPCYCESSIIISNAGPGSENEVNFFLLPYTP